MPRPVLGAVSGRMRGHGLDSGLLLTAGSRQPTEVGLRGSGSRPSLHSTCCQQLPSSHGFCDL